LIDEIYELVNETSSGPGLIAVFPRGHFRTAIRYELAAGYYGSAGLGIASLKCWKKAAELWASLDQPERAKVCEEWVPTVRRDWPSARGPWANLLVVRGLLNKLPFSGILTDHVAISIPS
jgi:hypothetical protein